MDSPSQHYRLITVNSVFAGDFKNAVASINADLREAIKISADKGQREPWLDSLCYWTMYGEIDYQMGRYNEALIKFDTALQIYFDNSEWLKHITVRGQPSQVARPKYPWGTSARQGGIGNFNGCSYFMVHKNYIPVAPGGDIQPGVAEKRVDSRIHAEDIVLHLAWLIKRRSDILGCLSKYDKNTKHLANILESRPWLPNHFTSTWGSVLYGLTLSALGDDSGAETNLQKGLLMLNAYDHRLTALALNELGNIALRKGKAEAARDFYVESSYDSFTYNLPILLGETFHNASNAQRLVDSTKACAAIPLAFHYMKDAKNVSPFVAAPVLLEMAEQKISNNAIKDAAGFCDLTAAYIGKTPLMDSLLGARLHYVSSAVDFISAYNHSGSRSGNKFLQSGIVHFDTCLNILRHSSLRFFQLAKLESLFQNGLVNPNAPITERIAGEKYDELLRESTDTDWLLNPLDCWAALVFVPPSAYERQFVLALKRDNREKAFDIAEKAKQAKYLAALPLGEARLSAIRQLFEMPEETLPQDALLHRQTLAQHFSEFKKRSDTVKRIKQELAGITLVPQNPQNLVRQEELCKQLGEESNAQELLLRSMAVSRINAPPLFPPFYPLEQIKRELPDKTAILVFSEIFGNLYGFLIEKKSTAMWQVVFSVKEKTLYELVENYLKSVGSRSANQILTLKDLTDDKSKWKQQGAALLKKLLGNQNRRADFTELAIVPTGLLWYLPFETLCVESGDNQFTPLLTAGKEPLKVRYAPTASLAVPSKHGKRVNSETLVLLGKLKSSEKSAEDVLAAYDRFQQAGIKKLTAMAAVKQDSIKPKELPASANVFASIVPNLVVLDDISRQADEEPLAWSPFPQDKAKKKNPVSSWLPLPYGGPQLIVMPAFHTVAETALKEKLSRKEKAAGLGAVPGDDLFLSSMLLESCGAETILLSRWKTGGRSALDLTEQFLKEYPEKSSAEAWRHAVLTVCSSPINVKEEPRIKIDSDVEPPFANHPFFWGGYLLISRGELPLENNNTEMPEDELAP
ncbi:hypothetical protein FACS189419_05530 [Planctomycetales bacterium]|nr:hypothetical protein FACS189419_05530 [Planctomycetales bacterium]